MFIVFIKPNNWLNYSHGDILVQLWLIIEWVKSILTVYNVHVSKRYMKNVATTSNFLKLKLGCHLFTFWKVKSQWPWTCACGVLSIIWMETYKTVFLSSQRSDEPEENGGTLAYEEEGSLHGKEKRRKDNENLNGRATEQPSKKRKEDSSSTPHLDVKRTSPEKKVCEFVH